MSLTNAYEPWPFQIGDFWPEPIPPWAPTRTSAGTIGLTNDCPWPWPVPQKPTRPAVFKKHRKSKRRSR